MLPGIIFIIILLLIFCCPSGIVLRRSHRRPPDFDTRVRCLAAEFTAELRMVVRTDTFLHRLTLSMAHWFLVRGEQKDKRLNEIQRGLILDLLSGAAGSLSKGMNTEMVEQYAVCKAEDLFSYTPRLFYGEASEAEGHEYARCAGPDCRSIVDKTRGSIGRGQFLCPDCLHKWTQGELVRCQYTACGQLVDKSNAVRSKGGLIFHSTDCQVNWEDWE